MAAQRRDRVGKLVAPLSDWGTSAVWKATTCSAGARHSHSTALWHAVTTHPVPMTAGLLSRVPGLDHAPSEYGVRLQLPANRFAVVYGAVRSWGKHCLAEGWRGEMYEAAFQIEVLNQTAWWQQWMPVLTALLVAWVAYAGVVKSNRSNDVRFARELVESRHRDFRLWRRDNLLRLGSEAVAAAQNSLHELTKISHAVGHDDTVDAREDAALWQTKLQPIAGWGASIDVTARAFRMLDATNSATWCGKLSEAVMKAHDEPGVFMTYNKSMLIEYDALEEAEQQGEVDRLRAMRDTNKEIFESAKRKYADLLGSIDAALEMFQSAVEEELKQVNEAVA